MLMVFSSADGYYNDVVSQCRYSSSLKDMEYIRSYVFNKVEYVRFNSTVGKYVGYSEFGVHTAEALNQDPAILAQTRAQKDRVCKPNAQTEIDAILTKKGE